MQSKVIEHVDVLVPRRHPPVVTGHHEASVVREATWVKELPYGCIKTDISESISLISHRDDHGVASVRLPRQVSTNPIRLGRNIRQNGHGGGEKDSGNGWWDDDIFPQYLIIPS